MLRWSREAKGEKNKANLFSAFLEVHPLRDREVGPPLLEKMVSLEELKHFVKNAEKSVQWLTWS